MPQLDADVVACWRLAAFGGTQQLKRGKPTVSIYELMNVMSPALRFISKGKEMNKSLLTAVGFALVLTACATGAQKGFKPFGVRAANMAYVSVGVVNDAYIVVSQEPIYVQQSDDNAIYWSLDPSGPYYFPDTPRDRGISFQPPPPHPTDLKCTTDGGDKYTFVCTYKRATKTKYPYLIKVTKDGTNILKSDPTVMND